MDFKNPWASIAEYPPGNGKAMVEEARKEIGSDHLLADLTLTTLARREDCDDVLFLLDDGPKVAVVHLTWTCQRERSGFPVAEIFADISDFARTRMKTDHLHFGEDEE